MQSFPTPESIINTEHLGPHFSKYHIGHGLALHHIKEANDPHFHGHPWKFRSSIIKGGYIEEVAEIGEDGKVTFTKYERLPGTSHEVPLGTIHRLVRLLDGDCWSLVEAGPENERWSFYRFDMHSLYFRYPDGEWTKLIK